MKLTPFKQRLYQELRGDPEAAAIYLEDAITEGDLDEILLAVQDIIEANGGLGRLSKNVDLHRTSVYKLFSDEGNPLFSSVLEILAAVGIGLKPYVRDREAYLELGGVEES